MHASGRALRGVMTRPDFVLCFFDMPMY